MTTGGDVEDDDEPAVDEAEPAEAETRIFTVRRVDRRRRDAGSVRGAAGAGGARRARLHALERRRHQRSVRATRSSAAGPSRSTPPPSLEAAAASLARSGREARVVELPVAATFGRAAYIAGTFDTKGRELGFLRNCLEKLGLRTVTVDLATSGAPSPASVPPREVARHHPGRRAGGVHRRSRLGGGRRWPSPSSASS